MQYNAIQLSGAVHLQYNCPTSIAPPPFSWTPFWVTPKGRLKNGASQVVDSDNRADTLAAHLERVQWA
eukprot:9366158-Pyramimonas_sp.AAC.1